MKFEIALTTPRIGTMLAFANIASDFSEVVRVYPGIKRKNGDLTWRIHAETSQDLIKEINRIKRESDISLYVNNIRSLVALTAGLLDSDGSITLCVKQRLRRTVKRQYLVPEVHITNTNIELLRKLEAAWVPYDINFKERISTKKRQ